jgi:endonuclease I
MKIKFILLIVCITNITMAQIPSGYYNNATGSGYTLKTQLYNKILGHNNISYAALWTAYSTTDRDNHYENDNTIMDIYSENPTGTDPVIYNYSTNQCGTYTMQGDCYNREHIVPQSVFGSLSPMQSDAHFVVPVDGYVNGQRSNNPHGNVAVANWTSLNGSKRGTSAVAGYTGTVFEPINEFKGDIARMYFYFATRYENVIASYSFPMFNGTSNQVFTTSFLNMLLAWHTQDPVSAREIARNNAVYALQNNRNPYIDHPEYANYIWGTNTPQTITFNPLSNAVYGANNFVLTATASSGLPIQYVSTNTNVATVVGGIISVIGIGTTNIITSQAGNVTFDSAVSISRVLVVTPKPIQVSATANNKVYDGTNAATISAVLQGVVGSDIILLNSIGTFSTANAGTNISVNASCTISGAKMANYSVVQPIGLSATILPRMIAVQ